MADNYLERRMDDLRNGRIGRGAEGRGVRAEGMLVYPYRALRVLVLAANRKHVAEALGEFARRKCKVALFSNVPLEATDLDADSGVRFVRYSDADDAVASWETLVKAWRDVDLIVVLDVWPLRRLADAICRHAASLPYPNDWGMPILVAGNRTLARIESDGLTGEGLREEVEGVAPLEDTDTGNPVIKSLPFASLKQNKGLKRIEY